MYNAHFVASQPGVQRHALTQSIKQTYCDFHLLTNSLGVITFMPCDLNPQLKIMSMVSSWYVAREYHLYSIIGDVDFASRRQSTQRQWTTSS